MTARSGQEASRGAAAGPVVICCAEAEKAVIAEVASDLEGEGHDVEVLAGIESDPKRLVRVIERLDGEGLYVLCRSRALGRDTIDELRDILLAAHVPFGRTLTVASTQQRELRQRIQAGLKRVTASRSRRAATTRTSPADPATRMPPKLAAKTSDAPVRPGRRTMLGIPVPPGPAPTAAPPSPEKDAAKTRPAEPPKVAPGPSGQRRTASIMAAVSDELSTAVELDDAKRAASEREQNKIEAAISRAADRPLTDKHAAIESLTNMAVPLDDSGPIESLTNMAQLEEEDLESGELPLEGAPEKPAVPRPAPVEPSGGLITPADLEGIGSDDGVMEISGSSVIIEESQPEPLRALITGHTAIVHQDAIKRPPPRAPLLAAAPSPPGATYVPAPPASPSAPALMDEAETGGSRIPWIAVGIGGAALILFVLVAVVVGSGSDDDDDTQQAEASDQADKDKKGNGGADGDATRDTSDKPNPQAGAMTAQRPGQIRTVVMDALRERKVRALDTLLVSADGAAMGWTAARDHCRALEIEGLTDWRLPEIGELQSLRTAGMIGRGYYWSNTPADTFGDFHFAWYGRRDRVYTRGRESIVICVRGERAVD